MHVNDRDGEYVDPTTGVRITIPRNRGGGGHGLTQTDVLAVTEHGILISVRSLLASDVDLATSTFTATPLGASFVKDAKYLDNWMNPADLLQFKDDPDAGLRLFREPFKIGDRTFNALRISYRKGDTSNSYVYDLESGILLQHRSSTRVRGGAGGDQLQLSNGTLVSVRALEAPWFGTDLPPAIANVDALHWEGANTLHIAGGQPISLGLALDFRAERRGRDYVFGQTTMTSFVPGANVPAGDPSKSTALASSYQLTPLAIAPQVLGTLRAGQVIDEDPATKYRVAVTFAGRDAQGNDVVVLTETAGQGQMRYDLVYDRATGLNVAGTTANPSINTTVEMRLRGRE